MQTRDDVMMVHPSENIMIPPRMTLQETTSQQRPMNSYVVGRSCLAR